MKNKNEELAYYIYPLPNGTDYYEKDLDTEEKVVCLFDYCQIYLATIWSSGWKYLIEKYGYKELFKINKISDWIDCENLTEFIEEINYEWDIAKQIDAR